MIEECGTCKFSRPGLEDGDNPDQYECRRHAPRPSDRSGRAKWPTVDVKDWCGEWAIHPGLLEDESDG